MGKFDKHIFICTNQREECKKCCGEKHGVALVEAFKKSIKEKNIKSVRAQRAGCIDMCKFGPALVVYPEGVFYGNVQLEDVEEIVNEHIANDRIVKRLQIDTE